MSREVQVRFCESRAVQSRPATHLLALCHSREQAEQVKARLAEWLTPRGLVFNEDKTQITHIDQGVDFLGFTIRRFRGGKLLTKPSTMRCGGSGNGCPPRRRPSAGPTPTR